MKKRSTKTMIDLRNRSKSLLLNAVIKYFKKDILTRGEINSFLKKKVIKIHLG